MRDLVWDCVLPHKHAAGGKEVAMFVMDLAEAGELFDYLKETGPFSEPVSRRYFRNIMLGTVLGLLS